MASKGGHPKKIKKKGGQAKYFDEKVE